MSLQKKKFCWVSKQTKDGWDLALAIGESAEYRLKGLRLASPWDVKKCLKGSVVFVERRPPMGKTKKKGK